MAFKLNLAHFKAPTPDKIVRLGRALVVLSSASGGSVMLSGHPLAGAIIFILGTIGRVLMAFFAIDGTVQAPPPPPPPMPPTIKP